MSVREPLVRILEREVTALTTERDQLRAERDSIKQEIEMVEHRAYRAEAEVSKLTDALDMMRDEFMRIIACPGCNAEIEDLANRAQLKLIQRVPVITQRDLAEAELVGIRALAVAALDQALDIAQAELDAERQKVRALTAILESICEEWGRNHDANPIGAGQKMATRAGKALEATEDAL